MESDEPFYVAEIVQEEGRIRLNPESLDGLSAHDINDAGMATGLLAEIARVLGRLGYVPNPDHPGPFTITDPLAVLSGGQSLPWQAEKTDLSLQPFMRCFEGHGQPWLCTAP